jgi:hypothetical protein
MDKEKKSFEINKNSPFELDEEFFQRNQFYGWDFYWYAVDSEGSIAQLSSGYAPIPERVFLDKTEYIEINDYFQNLPPITKSYLSSRFQEIKNQSPDGYLTALEDAKRGLYVFEEKSDWSNNYEICALPEKELKLCNLPAEVQKFLNPLTIETVKFREVEEINVLHYFKCDINA